MFESMFAATRGSVSIVVSADGTPIAFERRGSSRPVILVGGALNDRRSLIAGLPMADLLSERFAVYAYDRRGRGDSGDTLPYAKEREIEDIAALIDRAGEPAFLFGHSSGAALALEAAAAGLPVAALAVYDPPYSPDDSGEADNRAFSAEVAALLRAGRNGDAAAFFMTGTGMPPEMIESAKEGAYWRDIEAMASTLMYDTEIVGFGAPPLQRIHAIHCPLLAMSGGESPDWMIAVSRAVADAAPRGEFMTLEGQDHMVPPEIVAAELKRFFET